MIDAIDAHPAHHARRDADMSTALNSVMRPPSNPFAQAQAHFEAGRHQEAAAICKRLVKAQPGNAQPLHLLALCLSSLSQGDDAIKTIRKAERAAPESVPLLVDYAKILQSVERYDEAETKLREAVRRDPDFPYAAAALITLLRVIGRHDDACQLAQDSIDRHADSTPFVIAFSQLAPRLGRTDHAIDLLKARLEFEPDPPIASEILLRLAELCDKRGDHTEAWDHCAKANSLIDQGFDARAHAYEVDNLISAWSEDQIASLARATTRTELPVLIVGMPRSGTSLVEQILASHPRVHGCGELPDLYNITRQLRGPGPTFVPMITDTRRLNKATLDRLQRQYLRTLKLAGQGADRVTDKLPDNGFHIGLISRMLPGARVIRMRRSPIDIAISCYFRKFVGPYTWPYNPESIADFMADNERVIDHFARVTDTPILDVQYETLTREPEPQIRRILEFVGVDWDEACLSFHTSKRVVSTNSNEQVRQPMYTTEIDKSLRFGESATPIIDALRSRGLI